MALSRFEHDVRVDGPTTLAGRPASLPHPDHVNLVLAWAHWEQDGEAEPVIAHRVSLGGPKAAPSPEALRRGLEAAHAPLVHALAARTRLGRAALWRLVTDAVAQAFLEAGREAGDPGRGMAFARVVLGAKGSPLANRQWGFVGSSARRPDGRPARDWVRARGGCCRVHTVEGGERCATCVLRDKGSRDAMLRDRLATRPEPAAPPTAATSEPRPMRPDPGTLP